jgi:hypothetical protein
MKEMQGCYSKETCQESVALLSTGFALAIPLPSKWEIFGL